MLTPSPNHLFAAPFVAGNAGASTSRIPYQPARVSPSAPDDSMGPDNVYLLDRRADARRREPLAPLAPPHARSGEQNRVVAPAPLARASEFFTVAPGQLLPRYVPRDLYDNLEYKSLSAEQVQRVPEFDFTLQERTLGELERPVCCFSGNVAHIFAFDELMKHWTARRTNPFTGAELNRSDIFRVANGDPKAPSTSAATSGAAPKSNL